MRDTKVSQDIQLDTRVSIGDRCLPIVKKRKDHVYTNGITIMAKLQEDHRVECD